MKTTKQEYDILANKILTALSLLDEKGTNENVTRAMAIVCEGFRQNAAKRRFSAKDLFRSGNAVLSCE
ncbi:hypothetical protein ER57_17345 [Smithella sp. SCADC]|jgi:hypothetical protein|nr:hypothetical protein ER57_17345 [Smithella sp. SCADC]HAR49235.1 hypothetical protein [Smithella sp.]